MLMVDMTWNEVEKHISEVIDNLIIPVGTCEQHGYHLPLGNDTFIVEYMANILSERTNALVAPTINYGVNLPLSPAVLIEQPLPICQSQAAQSLSLHC
jgi:creatinine amidohydrolase